ncbi:MAG: sigma-54 dependent transcriptional regulator [Chlamydiae bacterium]|nr:Regulatory protein AtoC [Chlamydiales bacterium]MCH9703611.1 sigma-54 dependent transcriptional regulator [Chlamydiota bacterium]
MPIERILVVDDEPLMRSFLQEGLTRKGFDVQLAENGKEAFAALRKSSFDLVITDMKMPDVSGLDVVQKTKELYPNAMILVMTAHGTIENAVEAMQLGAFHYILKPFAFDALMVLIKKAQEHQHLVAENVYLREQIQSTSKQAMIAQSPVMKKLLEEAIKIAKSNASVFIQGESGTGKEVMAAAIHAHSLRSNSPYIRVNCAAVPDTLIESEFFGHEKGAFTGAQTRRMGRFELADRGTLLLDEVTEIPLNLQPKLLRAIQEHEFERVGGSKPINVDIRLISTSNRDLKEALEQKIMREDLYYRLNVVPIKLPPLRERKEDILPLAHYFLEKFSQENRKKKMKLSKAAEKKLLAYDFPGNIRELANLIERMCVLESETFSF